MKVGELARAVLAVAAASLLAACAQSGPPPSSAMSLAPAKSVGLLAAYKPLAPYVGMSCARAWYHNGHHVYNEVTFVPRRDGTVEVELITSTASGPTGMGDLRSLAAVGNGSFKFVSAAGYTHTLTPGPDSTHIKDMIPGVFETPTAYTCVPAGQKAA